MVSHDISRNVYNRNCGLELQLMLARLRASPGGGRCHSTSVSSEDNISCLLNACILYAGTQLIRVKARSRDCAWDHHLFACLGLGLALGLGFGIYVCLFLCLG